MQATIGARLVSALTPQNKPYEVRDDKLKGFILRVQPSGSMSYIAEYGRGKRITIGKAGTLKPEQAREKAKELLAGATLGADPMQERKEASADTFKEYVEQTYSPWAMANRKDGKATVERLKACFFDAFGKKKLGDITPWIVEKWRTQRIKDGKAPSTINRDIVALKSALSKAVEWGDAKENTIASVKLAKLDHAAVVRYLSKDEEARLRKALDEREHRIREARKSGNKWRETRDREKFPDLKATAFADHLKPLLLLALNTGMRRGELFSLTWECVDVVGASLAVAGDTAKSGKTRHIPLNAEALAVLKGWRKQTNGEGVIFKSHTGEKFDNIKKSFASVLGAANIQNFRFHDTRHSFASKLVMAGVDLNTVRELLGHGDIKMTLRYAHLAPEHKAAAVARLVAK